MIKFVTDSNLGTLAKWLRLLGYDTVYFNGPTGRDLLNYGFRQERTVITRRQDMAKRNYRGHMVVIKEDKVAGQLKEIKKKISLKIIPDNFFSRCLRCNETLKDREKKSVQNLVPPYVFQTQDHFRVCPSCQKIYWSGTHKDRIMQFLIRHNLIDRL